MLSKILPRCVNSAPTITIKKISSLTRKRVPNPKTNSLIQQKKLLNSTLRLLTTKSEKAKPEINQNKQEKTKNEKQEFSDKPLRFSEKFYVPTFEIEPLVLLFGVASLVGFCSYALAERRKDVDQKSLKTYLFWKRHFSCNLENVMEGRVYTLLTNVLTMEGSLANVLVHIVSLLIWGSNAYTFLGKKFIFFYFSALVGSNGIGVLLSYLQYKNAILQRNLLQDPEPKQTVDEDIVNFEKKKYLALIERKFKWTFTIESVPEKQKEILALDEKTFMELSTKRYLERPSVPSGGDCLSIIYYSLERPFAKLAIKSVPIPMVGVAIFSMLGEGRNYEYSFSELVIVLSGVALLGVTIFFYARRYGITKAHSFVKYDPKKYSDTTVLPKWMGTDPSGKGITLAQFEKKKSVKSRSSKQGGSDSQQRK
eukprot:TRINITY_DN10699_c0_g1_i1.p1 TRINITY_DN10699_c0_g1~~TRINITY_DN10699_c0_g1_i1.p1  ORF type:complete len:424 (+),score=73.06 TRINITY_DN10699_c0_g1_i1:46-1317(+)